MRRTLLARLDRAFRSRWAGRSLGAVTFCVLGLARSLGLGFTQVFGMIVLPQAMRAVIAPMGSVLIALTKNTTVASIIAGDVTLGGSGVVSSAVVELARRLGVGEVAELQPILAKAVAARNLTAVRLQAEIAMRGGDIATARGLLSQVIAAKPDAVLIVGAGSAGCVLADRLTRGGRHRVLLLEAGPRDWHPFIHMPAAIAKLAGMMSMNWDYYTEPEPQLENRRLWWPRGRVLGGSSSINAMCYIRGDARDYDEWARLTGDERWNWNGAISGSTRCTPATSWVTA